MTANKNAIERGRPQRPTPPPAKEDSTPSPAPPAAPEMETEVRDRKIMATVDEYLNLNDTTEAFECLEELVPKAASVYTALVTSVVSKAQESKDSERALLCKLLLHLIEKGRVERDAFMAGLAPVIELLNDTAIDIPLAPSNVGEIIALGYSKDMVDLTSIFESEGVAAMYGESALKFVLQTLAAISKGYGNGLAAKAVKDLKALVEFLPEGRRKDETVAELADRYVSV